MYPYIKTKQAILHGEDTIKITFPYNPAMVDIIKTLIGRKWFPKEKFWTAPLIISNITTLIGERFELCPKLQQWHEKELDFKSEQIKIPNFKKTLYPFQKEGVVFIEKLNGKALIADEMGLGKTIQSLAWLQLHQEIRPCIVVCPASVKYNWEREIKECIPNQKTEVLSGKTPYPLLNIENTIYIINYDILSGWVATLLYKHPQVIILDEVHYTKNAKTQRTKTVKQLVKKINYIIALSGTPITNQPIEFFNILSILNNRVWNNWWRYAQKYCAPKHNGYGWDFSGASNTEELNRLLKQTVMIRRKKEDVLKDLPPKTRVVIPLDIINTKEYREAKKEFLRWARSPHSGADSLVEIEKLKQLAVRGKITQCINWITDFINTGEKLVVFTTHTEILNKIYTTFERITVKLDGSTPPKQRPKIISKFQNNDKIRLFVGNIKAAGEGITLTASSNTCFLELAWTPAAHDQAEDRVHRIGQKDAVTAWYLLGKDTIEEKIAKLLDRKRKILDMVLDGKTTTEDSLLTELMNQMREEG